LINLTRFFVLPILEANIVETEQLKSTTVPCQYWYNDQWYDLTDFDNSVAFFESSHVLSTDPFAAYNFCQKINKATKEAGELNC
jgi:hypothetical protein